MIHTTPMQRFLPVLALLFFFVSESFIKKGSSFALVSVIPLMISAGYLFFQFRKNSKEPTKDLFEFSVPAWSILVLVLLAGLLRFWKLGTLFEGLGWDEAYKGLDAIAIQDFGDRPVFLNWNAGRDALVAYLVALSHVFFGYSVMSVRMASALAGTLSVLFIYLFAKELFGKQTAWIAAFLLAVSKWHMIHSRYAVRAALFPLFELAALYLTVRALRSDKPKLLLLAGLVTGIGFYTYTAYRIFPFILICLLLDKSLRSKAILYWKFALAGAVVCTMVLLPFIVYTVQNPEGVFDRMGRTAVWDQGGDKHPLLRVLGSVGSTLGMFTFSGDPIIKHNVLAEPMLSPFLCGAFLLGIVALFSRSRPVAIFLLTYLMFSLLPGFLTLHAPQASRTIGAAPPAMIIAAIGLMAAG